jgi:hypothetical protein
MNKNQAYYIVLICCAFLAISTSACKSKVKVAGEKYTAKKKDLPSLFENISKNEFNCNSLTAKASGALTSEGKTTKFKANIRFIKDSAIWVSISPGVSIEAARLLITQDSVFFMDRIHSQYYKGSFEFISEYFNADVSFKILQGLLLGNTLDLGEEEQVKISTDNEYFLLSELKKRKLKKVVGESFATDEDEKPTEQSAKQEKREDKDKEKKYKENRWGNAIYSIWVEPVNYKVVKQSFYDMQSQKSLFVEFAKHFLHETQLFPGKTIIHSGRDKNADVFEIDFSSITTEVEVSMPFKIPEKYEAITF